MTKKLKQDIVRYTIFFLALVLCSYTFIFFHEVAYSSIFKSYGCTVEEINFGFVESNVIADCSMINDNFLLSMTEKHSKLDIIGYSFFGILPFLMLFLVFFFKNKN